MQPGDGHGPPGMRQRRCPRFLHRLCFTLSFQPLSLPLPESPLAVLGELGRGKGPGSGSGVPVVLRPGQALPAAPTGRAGTCGPAGCGDTGDLPRQAAPGPESRAFYFILFLSYDLAIINPTKPPFGLIQPLCSDSRRGRRSELCTSGRGTVRRVPTAPPHLQPLIVLCLWHCAPCCGGIGPAIGASAPLGRGEEPGGCGIPSPPRGAGAGRVQRVCA